MREGAAASPALPAEGGSAAAARTAAAVAARSAAADSVAAARQPLLAFVPVMAGAADMSTPLNKHQGNAVSGFLLALPTHLHEPSEQLSYLVAQTSVVKRSHIAIALGIAARWALSLLPRQLLPTVVPLVASAASCCGVSSLRGPATAHALGTPADCLYL